MKKNNEVIIPSIDEIIEINKELEENFSVDEGALDFIISKIKSKKLTEDRKRDIAKRAAVIWQDIITNHPFMDGNKRTATESMLLFIDLNKFELKVSPNGLIYMSLKIANDDISYNKIIDWIYHRLEKKEEK